MNDIKSCLIFILNSKHRKTFLKWNIRAAHCNRGKIFETRQQTASENETKQKSLRMESRGADGSQCWLKANNEIIGNGARAARFEPQILWKIAPELSQQWMHRIQIRKPTDDVCYFDSQSAPITKTQAILVLDYFFMFREYTCMDSNIIPMEGILRSHSDILLRVVRHKPKQYVIWHTSAEDDLCGPVTII